MTKYGKETAYSPLSKAAWVGDAEPYAILLWISEARVALQGAVEEVWGFAGRLGRHPHPQ
jgi:hypothetical protein